MDRETMRRGIVYGVGVGPGDPELMTLKAVRLIRESTVIAVPGKEAKRSAAYRIAAAAVPEMEQKEILALDMPMTEDREVLQRKHREGADKIREQLDRGENVVYLTLGDPTIYSSFMYLKALLEADGYQAEPVSGVPSFCAAAARLGLSLAERDELLHIVPGLHADTAYGLPDLPGNCVLMKPGSHMKMIREELIRCDRDVSAVVNCGMDDEQIFQSAQDLPDEAGYFSLIIVKDSHKSSSSCEQAQDMKTGRRYNAGSEKCSP